MQQCINSVQPTWSDLRNTRMFYRKIFFWPTCQNPKKCVWFARAVAIMLDVLAVNMLAMTFTAWERDVRLSFHLFVLCMFRFKYENFFNSTEQLWFLYVIIWIVLQGIVVVHWFMILQECSVWYSYKFAFLQSIIYCRLHVSQVKIFGENISQMASYGLHSAWSTVA